MNSTEKCVMLQYNSEFNPFEFIEKIIVLQEIENTCFTLKDDKVLTCV